MARNDRARAAASHLPGSAGVSDLAARRQAVAERLAAKKRTENIERLMDELGEAVAVDHRARTITDSLRRHPSGGRPYDREAEG